MLPSKTAFEGDRHPTHLRRTFQAYDNTGWHADVFAGSCQLASEGIDGRLGHTSDDDTINDGCFDFWAPLGTNEP
jgi:hypothetical protein